MAYEDDDKIYDEFGDYCEEVVKANQAWKLRWPNACSNCEGAGGFAYPEGHGEYDSCSCIDSGKCPRCSTAMNNVEGDETIPCPHCKWNWNKGDDDAAPQI